MKISLIGIWVVIFFLNIATHSFAEETIRIAIGEWPPYTSKELKHYGVVSRIVAETFALEGVKVVYGFFPWARCKYYAKEGEWDGTAVWAHSPERAKYFLFSDPVIEVKYVFFHLKSFRFDWNSYEDLKGIAVGGTIEYNYGKDFQSAEKSKKIKVQRAPSDEINFKKLLAGRVKIIPIELDNGYQLLQKKFRPEDIQSLTYHPKPVSLTYNHLMLSKKVKRIQRMLKLFNRSLKRLRESGKYEQYFAESRRGKYKK